MRPPREVQRDRVLQFTPGTVVEDLRVIVTNRTARVRGTVVDESGEAVRGGSVVLFPVDPTEVGVHGWGFQTAARIRSRSGTYDLGPVRARRHLVAAIDIEPYRLTRDTELMERARAAAIPIDLSEGIADLDLPLVRLRPFVRVARGSLR